MASNPLLGPLMFDLRGHAPSPEEKELLRHPAAGGVIFFTRNYENPAQIAGLAQSLRALRPGLLIAADHEGGRVQRFRDGFTRLPPAARYAERLGQDELRPALEAAGWLMAAELRAVGVDFSFAPVLDVDRGVSQVIGDRAFSRDAGQAGECALAFAQGMRRAGMAAVGKHFPGHGAVAADSHLALPEDPRFYEDIAAQDLQPFIKLIAAGLEGVMPAHVVYPEIDALPAGFSRRWIQGVLRKALGFNGAVFSDDLSMEGAAAFADSHADRVRLAVEAGCDMALLCNTPEAVGFALESLERDDWKERQPRLAALRGRFPVDRAALLSGGEWRAAAARVDRLNETTV